MADKKGLQNLGQRRGHRFKFILLLFSNLLLNVEFVLKAPPGSRNTSTELLRTTCCVRSVWLTVPPNLT